VAETNRKPSSMAIGRKIIPNNNGAYELRETSFPRGTQFDTKKECSKV